jgi:hypothetical protein
MKLFSDIERDFTGPSETNEDSFSYYERSARKDIGKIRDLLEKWFQNLPETEKYEVKKRFEKSFDSVFYELFLFNFFKELGYEIIIHPQIDNTDKKPDFLVSKDGIEIYIEAKICKDKSNFEESNEKLIERFYETIDKIESPHFMFNIETLQLKTKNQPSTKELVRNIKNKIAELDHKRELIKTKGDFSSSLPKFENLFFENEDILINIEFLPVNEDAIGKPRRSIGMRPIETFIGGAEESIRESILTKAKRYGKLDKPYLICINTLSIKSSSYYDIDAAIWGSIALSFSTDPNNRDEKWIRSANGIFYNNGSKRITNVSGIMINRIFPHNVASSSYWIFEHPFTNNKLDFKSLELPYCYVENGYVYNNEGNNLGEIFKLNKDWLNE